MANRIAIIGAGPAGSIAAIILGRAGIDVTLIEQHRFPRRKVCGECISALGIDVLTSLGLLENLFERGARRFESAQIHSTAGASAHFNLPRPMAGLSRECLDSLLLEKAIETGNVRLIQPARSESRLQDLITIRKLDSNEIETLETDVILDACGRADARPTNCLGIKAHFRNIRGAPRDTIELFGLRDCYGGIAPIEDNRYNVSLAVPTSLLRPHRGNIDVVFKELCDGNPTLRKRMKGAEREGAWLASPLPRFPIRAKWSEGIIPIGNAAAAIEPIGGEGMGLAMRSAQLAAEAIVAARRARADVNVSHLRASFKRLWRTRAIACRIAGWTASHPRLLNALLPLIDEHHWPARSLIEWMGKKNSIEKTQRAADFSPLVFDS